MRFFAFNKLAGCFRTVAAGIAEDTTAGMFDSTFVANAIRSNGGITEYFQTAPFKDAASTTTLWLHFEVKSGGFPGGTFDWVTFVNSTGTTVAKLVYIGATGYVKFQYWDGAAFQDYGDTFTISDGTLYRLDFRITSGASGTFDAWKAGTQVATDPAGGLDAATNNIAAVRFWGMGSCWFSQIIGQDSDTRDFRLAAAAIDGEGATTNGTGAYTDVNETPLDETTGINLPAVNDLHLFTKAAITLPGGYVIDSAWINARSRVSGGTVTDGKHVFRSGGSNYASAGLSPAAAYEPRMHYSATNPNTGLPWTETGYNNAQVGVQGV
jgi:hypothetical protein